MSGADEPRSTAAPRLRIVVLTLFPELISDYCAASIIGRAQRAGVVDVTVCDLRAMATDERRTVDDAPFGGGAGMVLAPEPVVSAIEHFAPPRPIIQMSPAGRRFDQLVASSFARELAGFTLLCGRYEGIDQRVTDRVVDEELSVGDYVLAGGELAALVVIEAVTRLVPGVVGNDSSIEDESFTTGLLEYPQYTRPADFRGDLVPEVLRSGDHGAVERWRRAQSLIRTIERRPDLIEKRGGLSAADVELLSNHGYPLGAAEPDRAGSPTTANRGDAAAEERDQL